LDLAVPVVLVVNAGSTSLKLSLVEGDTATKVDGFDVTADAVAHRVVHGGERFREPLLVDDAVVQELERLVELAPLHNAPALRALKEARAALPDVPHVAVFDTAFHATLPAVASSYAISPSLGIRRYGFHGLAVQSVSEQVRVPRLVVCHLGGGCSVTAVRDGRSVETSMGFTPLEGVPMATRSGSVDPGAVLYLARGRGIDEVERVLEHESGLYGVSGLSGDVRVLQGDPRGDFALELLAYRVAQAVAACAVSLGGVDVVAFSGGIGEHSERVRDAVVERLAFLQPFEARAVNAREDLVAARAARRLLGA
jgi:acetate kinase